MTWWRPWRRTWHGHQPRKNRPPANYDARGKFGAPEPHERVRVVDGKVFAACRVCGWKNGGGVP